MGLEDVDEVVGATLYQIIPCGDGRKIRHMLDRMTPAKTTPLTNMECLRVVGCVAAKCAAHFNNFMSGWGASVAVYRVTAEEQVASVLARNWADVTPSLSPEALQNAISETQKTLSPELWARMESVIGNAAKQLRSYGTVAPEKGSDWNEIHNYVIAARAPFGKDWTEKDLDTLKDKATKDGQGRIDWRNVTRHLPFWKVDNLQKRLRRETRHVCDAERGAYRMIRLPSFILCAKHELPLWHSALRLPPPHEDVNLSIAEVSREVEQRFSTRTDLTTMQASHQGSQQSPPPTLTTNTLPSQTTPTMQMQTQTQPRQSTWPCVAVGNPLAATSRVKTQMKRPRVEGESTSASLGNGEEVGEGGADSIEGVAGGGKGESVEMNEMSNGNTKRPRIQEEKSEEKEKREDSVIIIVPESDDKLTKPQVQVVQLPPPVGHHNGQQNAHQTPTTAMPPLATAQPQEIPTTEAVVVHFMPHMMAKIDWLVREVQSMRADVIGVKGAMNEVKRDMTAFKHEIKNDFTVLRTENADLRWRLMEVQGEVREMARGES